MVMAHAKVAAVAHAATDTACATTLHSGGRSDCWRIDSVIGLCALGLAFLSPGSSGLGDALAHVNIVD